MRGKYDVIVFRKYLINNYSFTLLSFNLVPRVKIRFAYTLAKWGFCNKVNGSILPWALPAYFFLINLGPACFYLCICEAVALDGSKSEIFVLSLSLSLPPLFFSPIKNFSLCYSFEYLATVVETFSLISDYILSILTDRFYCLVLCQYYSG